MRITFLAAAVAAGFVTSAIAQQPSAQPQPRGGDRTDQVTFETADKNRDGKVNKEEAGQIAGFDFSRADTNQDATLSRQEFQIAMAKSTPRGDGVQGPHSGDRTKQVSFEVADLNKDGRIDRDEAAKIDGFNFSSADVDDNASLTRQEFQTAMAQSHSRG
jgi:alpha-D-ribose 1-methylphosphonate 5-triphosphate synthase subunit PhnI